MEFYRRPVYVGLLGLGVATLEFAAEFGTPIQIYLAYGGAIVLGGVVFAQSEVPVTAGSVFGNFLLGGVLGTALSLAATTGLVMYLLGTPWDIAGWQAMVLLWDSWAGILTGSVTGFFVAGLVGTFLT